MRMSLTLCNGVLHDETMVAGNSPDDQTASLRPANIDGVTYFTATDITAILGISRQTLWRWRRAGKIPVGHRFRDGQIVFTQKEVGEIREFAHRIEPIDASDRSQLELFKPPRT